MAAYTVRKECDERTGQYRENEAGEDRDPLQLGIRRAVFKRRGERMERKFGSADFTSRMHKGSANEGRKQSARWQRSLRSPLLENHQGRKLCY